MSGIREFLAGKGGRITAGIALVAMSAVIYAAARDYFAEADFAADSGTRVFICAETGKPFSHTLAIGDSFPLQSPHSGKATGYAAELCYWTADGHVKDEPTYVLLNEYRNEKGPTYCPDCDRLVTEMNEPPRAGATPPPTRAEHAKRKPRHNVPADQDVENDNNG
jgi:hypothetical protein